MKRISYFAFSLTLSLGLYSVVPLQAATATYISASQEQKTPTSKQLQKLGLENCTLSLVRSGIWKVSKNGQLMGHIVDSRVFASNVTGYNGSTPVLLFINTQKKVEHLLLLPNGETLEFFKKASSVVKNWKNISAKKGEKIQVDAVTGATYSSRSLIDHIKLSLQAYNKYVK